MPEVTVSYILAFSLAGSVGTLLGGAILVLKPSLHQRLRNLLLAYAVGTLLGASFLGLLPGAVEQLGPGPALRLALLAYLLFFIFEKILRLPHPHAQFHPHDHHHYPHHEERPAAILVLVGDSVHNLIDGVVIAASFMISIPLGIVTAVAVLAHEIPQEFGDLVVLLEGGFTPRKAYLLNFLSSLMCFVGAILTVWARPVVEPAIPYLLAFSGAGFLYVAATDLSPVLHHQTGRKAAVAQFCGILTGVVTIFALRALGD